MVTATISCAQFSDVKEMEAGYHLWLLVSDGASLWHVDAANPYQLWLWYRQHLTPDCWERVATGKAKAPNLSLDEVPFIWGTPSTHGIHVDSDTLSAEEAFFDVLDKVGKRDGVRQLFRSHGFVDPYKFTGGVLDIGGSRPAV